MSNIGWYDGYLKELGSKLESIQAGLTPNEKRWLYEAAMSLPENGVYIEVGTDYGGSAFIVSEANPTLTVFSIDPLNGKSKRKRFLKKRFADRLDRVHFVSHKSIDAEEYALNYLRTKLSDLPIADMIFLDGAHTAELITREIELYHPLLRQGGMLCGHDYHRIFHSRKRYSKAVRDGLQKLGLRMWVFDRIWYTIVTGEVGCR